MKKFKTYLSKEDTCFEQDYQSKRKYHTLWCHLPYRTFLKHKVVKIKLFGIFTIYDVEKDINRVTYVERR